MFNERIAHPQAFAVLIQGFQSASHVDFLWFNGLAQGNSWETVGFEDYQI